MVDVYNHVKHCTTHPKFLHSNSTSHRWVFGAVAELIDNAIDPDVSASQFCIDMKEFNGEPCLVFMDNGCGLVPEKLHKMLSFGHSKKQLTPGDRSIGKHGNGFKSGTMRLGKDVLVLTKCAHSMTAGFLSQTFLAYTGAEDILIPQVSWDLYGNRLTPMDLEIEESLRAICKFSIFPDEESLLAQLEAIPVTGAILIISNLRRHEGVLELDFETDPHDIRITSEINSSHFQQLRPNQPNTTEVPMDFSLRAYVSILYKVPRMQIFIRDKKVKTKRIAGILSQKETESYKPYGVAESIKIELGFNTDNKNLYGMMLYHRNRLIKAYMRVGMQLEENERGMGVIGLAEADFLQPTHNKQDFDDTTAYRRLLKKLSDVLAEYWWEKKERVHVPQLQMEPRAFRRGINVSTSEDVPDVIWVQCDNPTCLKWRILPPGTDVTILPDIWYCEYHPDAKYRRHEEPEQEWDTSVQHEIVERRKERKREYDREKKEREAERKRQRLEAATRDSQIALQRQRDALAKELLDQEAREELARKERKRREEEMKKLNEEYAAMEAKRDEMLKQQKEIERQLELAQEELAQKAKEKEESILATQEVHLEALFQAESPARSPLENGHVVREVQDEPTSPFDDSVDESLTVVQSLSERQIFGNNETSQNVSFLSLSDEPHGHHPPLEGQIFGSNEPSQNVPLLSSLSERQIFGGKEASQNVPLLPSPSEREMFGDNDTSQNVPFLPSPSEGQMCVSSETSKNVPSLPLSDQSQVHQHPFKSNGDLHEPGANGTPPPTTLQDFHPKTTPAGSRVRRPREASRQPCDTRMSLVALSKELIAPGTSESPQPSQRKGTSSSASDRGTRRRGVSSGPHKRSSKVSRLSQAPNFGWIPAQELQLSQRLEAREGVSLGDVPHGAVAPIPPTPSPGCSPSFNPSFVPAPLQSANPIVPITSEYTVAVNQHFLEAPALVPRHRSSLTADLAHQDPVLPPVVANGVRFEERLEGPLTGDKVAEEHPESNESNDRLDGQHGTSRNGAPLSGLRLPPPQGQLHPFGSGMLSVHLPMDSMVSTSNSRSEAELTLDKAVFSLQRRLRLALNTLVRLGGSGDSNLFELDVLPARDIEVVSICEKTKQHVETKMQNFRQEVESLKAELAYLTTDKTQQGQDFNFKIQSIANKWGVGLEVSKRG